MRHHYAVLVYCLVLVSLVTDVTSTSALPTASSGRNLRTTATPPAPAHRRTEADDAKFAVPRNLLAEKDTTATESDDEERVFGLEKVLPNLSKMKDSVMAKLSPALEKVSKLKPQGAAKVTKIDEQKAATPALEKLKKAYAENLSPTVNNLKKQGEGFWKSAKKTSAFKATKNQYEKTMVNLAPDMVDWKVRYRVKFKQSVESVMSSMRGGASKFKTGTKEYFAALMKKQEALLKQLSQMKVKDSAWFKKLESLGNSISKSKPA